jgi:hypothetical protein
VMASEVVREGGGSRFVAEMPELPGVIAIGETAWQAQMRAAVVALRAIVFDGADDRAVNGGGKPGHMAAPESASSGRCFLTVGIG